MTASATVIVPIKPWQLAKSRLDVGQVVRRDLARAFAMDVLEAVAASANVGVLVVVTAETGIANTAQRFGATVLPESRLVPSDPLNSAIDIGRQWALQNTPGSPLMVVPSDLPALTTQVLDSTIAQLRQADAAFVPDMTGCGTTVTWARSAAELNTSYGPDSARAHTQGGAAPLIDVDPRIRHDVDTMDDLHAAIRLGVGPHTQTALQTNPVTTDIRESVASL